MRIDRGRRTATLIACLLLLALAVPTAVAAHAELESTSPAAGATVEVPPEVVTATFSEALEADKSSIEVVVPGGASLATGGVAANDPKTLRVELPALAPGTYRVRWTASSDDGHLERGRFDFTVAAAASPASTPSPTAVTTALPSATPTTSASTTVAPTSSSPVASPGPSPAPDGSGGGSESIGQLVVIAVAGIGLGIGIGWWRSRRAA